MNRTIAERSKHDRWFTRCRVSMDAASLDQQWRIWKMSPVIQSFGGTHSPPHVPVPAKPRIRGHCSSPRKVIYSTNRLKQHWASEKASSLMLAEERVRRGWCGVKRSLTPVSTGLARFADVTRSISADGGEPRNPPPPPPPPPFADSSIALVLSSASRFPLFSSHI